MHSVQESNVGTVGMVEINNPGSSTFYSSNLNSLLSYLYIFTADHILSFLWLHYSKMKSPIIALAIYVHEFIHCKQHRV